MAYDRLAALTRRIERVSDVLAIQKLQSTYEQWLALFRADKILPLFSQSRSDVSVESGAPGVFEGIEAISQFFNAYCSKHAAATGVLVEHYAICPVIEVHKKGRTAKGTWFSPGILGSGLSQMQAWNWGKYSCDYIKEGTHWKIWHLHWLPSFRARYEKGWLHDQTAPMQPPKEGVEMPRANKPATYRKPYSPLELNYLLPEPPESAEQ